MNLEREAAAGIHRVEDAYVNWYLVEDDSGVTIVDTGLPRSWNSLREVLKRVGRTFDDVRAVVLTHAHFDHMGFAERARRELGVPVLAHEREVPVTQHPWRYDHERSRLPYFVRYPKLGAVFMTMGAAGALWVRGLSEASTYSAGTVLDVPGRPQVVFTPGHTHGHCSLFFADRDAVIAGDAVVTFNPYTGGEGPQIVSGAATADSSRALTSLEALARTGARRVLCGHGPVWADGVEAVADLARAAGPS